MSGGRLLHPHPGNAPCYGDRDTRNYPIICLEGLGKSTTTFSWEQPVSWPGFETGTSQQWMIIIKPREKLMNADVQTHCAGHQHCILYYIILYYDTALGYGLDDRWFEARQGLRIFLLTTASRLVLLPIHPSIQWESRTLSLGVKQVRSEANNSTPSSAKVKSVWTTPSLIYTF